MQSIDRIAIKGFKSIRELNLSLDNLNIFIGANGAGKSNFISIFNLMNRIVENKLQIYVAQSGYADVFLYFGQKHTSKIIGEFWFGRNGYEFSLIPSQNNNFIFEHEICYFHDKKKYVRPYANTIGLGKQETQLHSAVENGEHIAKHVLDAVEQWQVYHFHDTSKTSPIKCVNNINDNIFLRPNASNLAAYLFLLKNKYFKNYRNIIDTIKMAAPFFDDFILRPDPIQNDLIQLEWKEIGSDAYFNAHSFSDGTLRFICLATLLLQPHLPSTILLDEPELGLHPYAIAILADLLKSAAKSTQVIVSTQSVTLVNQFEPKDIIVVDRKDNQSVFIRLSENDMKHWVDEYGLGDLWEKNIFGGRP